MARFRDSVARFLLVGVCAGAGWGCGTDARGTDACRKIEQARCRKAAAACPALGLRGEVGLQECMQFARDHCLHGLAVSDPGSVAVDQCVNAIAGAASCEIVASPETAPACAFLKPTPGTDDAGAEASAETGPDDAATTGSGG